eukprot:27983_1
MINIVNNYLWILLTVSYVNFQTSHSHSSKTKGSLSKNGNVESIIIDPSDPIYITQDDILTGTYRIQSSGYYIISEDLQFNFNAPNPEDLLDELWSPNNYDTDNIFWYPSKLQSETSDSYSNTLYSLGFFAGITIECDNVIIDLNGHNIEMDYTFYLQQRFFSLIELGNRQFISGYNPIYNDDNNDEIYPSNIEIKNGLLGLTSHHSIHGNNINALIISDTNMHNF